MLHIALIPILGTLLLVVVSVIVVSRRSAGARRAKEDLDNRIRAIEQGDLRNDAELVTNLLNGVKVDECLVRHARTRTKLFPRPQSPSQPWTHDDLAGRRSEQLADDIETVNRRLLIPAIASAAVIIAICIVATTILYSFSSSAASGQAHSLPASGLPDHGTGDPWDDMMPSP